MADISIVTAFYDIGRAEWGPHNGHPAYLQRTTDTYIERFSHLTRLANDITVFTSEKLVERIRAACDKQSKVTIVAFDAMRHFSGTRAVIRNIQQSPGYRARIHPKQIRNPEYWSPDYVLITNLKAYFVNKAIEMGKVINDCVAWIDFGYCRSVEKIPPSRTWTYGFAPDKIHLFAYKEYDNVPIEKIVATNDVYVSGCKAVASKKLWPRMASLMEMSFKALMQKQLVDDDQVLWLYSFLLQPGVFALHRIPDHQLGHDPFVLFNGFNDSCGAAGAPQKGTSSSLASAKASLASFEPP
jgi:protein YibB